MNADAPADTCTYPDCGRPSDGWYVCARCADELTATLHRIPWLLVELDTVLAMLTRYTTGGSRNDQKGAPGVDWVASRTRTRLVAAVALVTSTLATTNRWDAPTDPSARAAWLAYRITAIRLHPDGGPLAHALARAAGAALSVVDRPAARQYLGSCADLTGTEDNPCPGSVYGREWRTHAACDTCGLTWDANELRRYLLDALHERLTTAAEIGRLSTYLALTIDRQTVRKRINLWHHRGILTARGTIDGAPSFRFGDAVALLARYEAGASEIGQIGPRPTVGLAPKVRPV